MNPGPPLERRSSQVHRVTLNEIEKKYKEYSTQYMVFIFPGTTSVVYPLADAALHVVNAAAGGPLARAPIRSFAHQLP